MIKVLIAIVLFLPIITQATQGKFISHTIATKLGGNERSINISLPKAFNGDRHYPTIFVLNTSDFYLGEFQQDVEHSIRQLEGYSVIPPNIIVYVNADQWYQDTISEPIALTEFITTQLPEFIDSRYQITDITLIGHSYAGAYLLNQSAQLQAGFARFMVLSAVFPDVDFIQQTTNNLKAVNSSDTKITLIHEADNQVDIKLLNNNKVLDPITIHSINHVNHHSVLSPGISIALTDWYKDYDTAKYLGKERHGIKTLKAKFKAIKSAYDLPSTGPALQNFLGEVAQIYMAEKWLNEAFSLWREASPRFRHYLIKRWGDRFLAQKDFASAKYTWQQLAELYPFSPFAWQKQITTAQITKDVPLKRQAQAKLTEVISSFPKSEAAMFKQFAQQNQTSIPAQSIQILMRVTQQTSGDIEAWQTLASLYSSQGQTSLAKQAEKHIASLK